MRLLVTRPLPDAKETASRLEAMGHSVSIDPLLQLEVLPRGQIRHPTAIVATSRNGVRAMATWPEIPFWSRLPFFAVGSATAAEAEATGFTDIRVGGDNGVGLAAFITQSMDPGVDAIVYVTARDRSPVLEATLRKNGFHLDVVVAYRMVAANSLDESTARALGAGQIDGVLLYSKRSAEVFRELVDRAALTPSLREMAVFVLSSAVADALSAVEIGRLAIAEEPNEAAMMAMIGAAGERRTR